MSINRGMDKEDVVHIYTTEYDSAIKKNERKGICSNKDGTRECHTEWNKSDRGEILYDISYLESEKKWYKWTYKKRKRLTDIKWTHGCWEDGIVNDFGKVIYLLLYLKWDNQWKTYCITMELCSMLCACLNARGLGTKWIHVCVWLIPSAVLLKLSQHC